MWFLTSCHLRANIRSKFHLDLFKVTFKQKVYKPCLILSGAICWKPKNRLMLKTKACENVPSSLELLKTVLETNSKRNTIIFRYFASCSLILSGSESVEYGAPKTNWDITMSLHFMYSLVHVRNHCR